jgi:hypothetical protein
MTKGHIEILLQVCTPDFQVRRLHHVTTDLEVRRTYTQPIFDGTEVVFAWKIRDDSPVSKRAAHFA